MTAQRAVTSENVGGGQILGETIVSCSMTAPCPTTALQCTRPHRLAPVRAPCSGGFACIARTASSLPRTPRRQLPRTTRGWGRWRQRRRAARCRQRTALMRVNQLLLTAPCNPMIEVDCMSGRLCFYAFMQRAMLSAMLLCRELCCIALHSPWHSCGHNFGNIALSIALGINIAPVHRDRSSYIPGTR